jgi:hypothetical protein
MMGRDVLGEGFANCRDSIPTAQVHRPTLMAISPSPGVGSGRFSIASGWPTALKTAARISLPQVPV